jgi:hypothetical protein
MQEGVNEDEDGFMAIMESQQLPTINIDGYSLFSRTLLAAIDAYKNASMNFVVYSIIFLHI